MQSFWVITLYHLNALILSKCKCLLLSCIATDRARELPSSLLFKLIYDNISKNYIPSVVNLDGNISIL